MTPSRQLRLASVRNLAALPSRADAPFGRPWMKYRPRPAVEPCSNSRSGPEAGLGGGCRIPGPAGYRRHTGGLVEAPEAAGADRRTRGWRVRSTGQAARVVVPALWPMGWVRGGSRRSVGLPSRLFPPRLYAREHPSGALQCGAPGGTLRATV